MHQTANTIMIHPLISPVQLNAVVAPERKIFTQKAENYQIFCLVLHASARRMDEN
jgi:hypothetical protein